MVETVGYTQIMKVWKLVISGVIKSQYIILYKNDLIEHNNNIWQQPSVTLCIDSNQNINNYISDFGYIKEAYNSDVLDLAIVTNSYNELIDICQGRPPGRAKSTVELQDNQTKKYCYLQPINNNQTFNKPEIANRKIKKKNTRKTCQNCRKKGHNRATCEN
ncbi:6967_t:CDS:2 [Cetraspora pellucida]|uniref:6967_t:CDS:1 n=1 Tax=Cetraspora pellucida TaxID=1433469 RepID=A0ACA9N2Z4_9GLOM|nr:6967_t:CDS:2 [Cetraspora pellucida]